MEGSFFTAGREGRKFRQEDRLRKKTVKKKNTQKRTEEEISAKQQSSDMRAAGKSQFRDGGPAERSYQVTLLRLRLNDDSYSPYNKPKHDPPPSPTTTELQYTPPSMDLILIDPMTHEQLLKCHL